MTGRPQRVNKRRQDAPRTVGQIREAGEALLRRVGPSLLVMLIVAGLPYLSYQAYLFAITSPSFALTTLEVSGADHVPREVLLEQGQIAPGINIFDVDQERVASLLELHPWIKAVKVETQLPGTLRVHVEEHVPVAVVIDEGRYVLLDGAGAPFKQLDDGEEAAEALLSELPLISGVSRESLEQSEAQRRRAIEALHVWGLWQESGLERAAPVAELHLDDVLGLSLIVGAQGTEVRLGWGKWEERLERFAIVYKDLIERGVAVDYVLVDQEGEINRVAVGPTITKDR